MVVCQIYLCLCLCFSPLSSGHSAEVNSLCPMPWVSSLVQPSLIDRFPGYSQFTSALCPTDETEARNTNTEADRIYAWFSCVIESIIQNNISFTAAIQSLIEITGCPRLIQTYFFLKHGKFKVCNME